MVEESNKNEINEHYMYPLTTEDKADAIAWVCCGANTPFKKYTYKFPELESDEIRVEILYSGICHTDIHFINGDWGAFIDTICPGHEIVGKVIALGKDVQNCKLGDIVGQGYIKKSCGDCKFCKNGRDNICILDDFMKTTGYPNFGGYSTHLTTPSQWSFKIPDSIPLEVVPPILCAGVTVFAPLRKYFFEKAEVGILGIGGLGHMGLQYAKKLGYSQVHAISTNKSKEEESKNFGADKFILFQDEEVKKNSGILDVLIITASDLSVEDFKKAFKLTGNGGTLVLVGSGTEKNYQFQNLDFIGAEKNIVGSFCGCSKDVKDCLEFSDKHKIYPKVELFNFNDIQKAFDYTKSGKAKYRSVIDVQGFIKNWKK